MSHPHMVACLRAHRIDSTEAIGMVKLLADESEDRQHELSIDEFIVSLLLLKDNNKGMVTTWYANKQLHRRLYAFMNFTNEHFMHQAVAIERQSSFNTELRNIIKTMQQHVGVLSGHDQPSPSVAAIHV